MPIDVTTGDRSGEGVRTVGVESLSADINALWDIGEASVEAMVKVCQTAKTVMWNGPLGKFEVPVYARGTKQLAEALAAQPDTYRVVGGGDTVTALERWRLTAKFDHVSVGGGAMVTFLEGKRMPGLEPLYTNSEAYGKN